MSPYVTILSSFCRVVSLHSCSVVRLRKSQQFVELRSLSRLLSSCNRQSIQSKVIWGQEVCPHLLLFLGS